MKIDAKIKESGGKLAVVPVSNIGSLLFILKPKIVFNTFHTVDDAISFFDNENK